MFTFLFQKNINVKTLKLLQLLQLLQLLLKLHLKKHNIHFHKKHGTDSCFIVEYVG